MSRKRNRVAPRVQPEDVHGLGNYRTGFYRDCIDTIVRGRFKVTCPDYWDVDYMLTNLIYVGHFVITDSVAGVLPFENSFYGVNYMNYATHALISVPELPQMQKRLDTECAMIYLKHKRDRYYYNFSNLINIFAERFASADACIDVNLMNSRVAYVIEAETRAQAETIKEAYSRVTNGEPLVVLRKGASGTTALQTEGMNVFFNSVKNNYIADLVQDSKRSIMNEMLTMLGVNNANTDKKERLITGEVDSNNEELETNIAHFKVNLKKGVETVHKLYPDIDFNIEIQEFNALKMKGAIDGLMGNDKSMGLPSPRS